MNILQQYQKAMKERGGAMYDTITHGELEIGEEFEFGGASWQRVGDTVSLRNGRHSSPIYGYAKIIRIDSGGFKTAKRTK
jgi:hypothetical protein